MTPDETNRLLMILRAVDIVRESVKRGHDVPAAELTCVDSVALQIWRHLHNDLG